MSRYGLGLTTEQSWDLTPREFDALRKVYDLHMKRWAIERADFRQANWPQDPPWTPEAFIGGKPKEKKIPEAFQRAILDQAMNVLPDWVEKLKGARKQ